MIKKVCTGCKIEKHTSEFHKQKAGKFGVHSECKECKKEYGKNLNIEYNPNALKVCGGCNIEKSTTEFDKYKAGKFGVQSKCKVCQKEYHKNKNVEYNPNSFKVCCTCKVEKSTTKFIKTKGGKYGVQAQCKECQNKYYKNKNVEYNPNALKVCGTCKVGKSTTEFSKYKGGKFGVSSRCRECAKECNKAYRQNNKESINKGRNIYQNKRRKTDQLYKLTHNIGTLIRESLKRGGYSKKSRTFEILGCDYEFFMQHIENQFEDWMTWDKWGLYNGEFNYGFDLDHIIPVSNGTTEEERIKLNHYTNFQPLCSKINRDIKRDKINY